MISTLSRFLAATFAVALAAAETGSNWGVWANPALSAVKYVAAAWLLVAGVKAGFSTGRPFLFGGWTFAAGMLFVDFFGRYQPLGTGGFHWSPGAILAVALLVVAVAGSVLTAWAMIGGTGSDNLKLPDDTVFG